MITFWIPNAIWIHQVIKHFTIMLIVLMLINFKMYILYIISCLIYPSPIKSNKDVGICLLN